MCGIAGFVDFNCKSSERILQNMGSALEHRGPNSSGKMFANQNHVQIGLAHQRLSIIDIEARSNQPMKTLDGRFELIYNGEVYNFKEIRLRLEALGDKFETESDTEVVLKSWQRWGRKCLLEFVGMFAFAIYDKKEETLSLVRDRVGVKPLYYYYKNGLFLFGSELKSLMQHPHFVRSINIDSTALFMKYGYYPEPYSVFNDCFKLKAGHTIELSIMSKELNEVKYWDILDYYTKPKFQNSEDELIEQLDEILVKSFNYRMVSDVPVGVFLSGGYDSSLVTSIIQKHSNNTVNTFTIGFEEDAYNEAPYAKVISNYLETHHTEEYCSKEKAKDLIPRLAEVYDEPFGDSSAIPTILVSEIARKHVTVSLSADGGDELFGGYGKYLTSLEYVNKLSKLPLKSISGNILKTITPLLKSINGGFNIERRSHRVNDLLNNGLSSHRAMDLSSQCLLQSEIDELFVDEVNSSSNNFNNQNSIVEELSSIDQMLSIDFKTYLPDDILTKVDRASMSVGLESREPFLDHHIAQFVAQIPDNYKINNGNLKHILKKLTHTYLPKEIMDRPKKGFSVPVKDWMKSDLRELLEETLSEENIKKVGVFNLKKVNELKTNYLSDKLEDFNPVWYLFIFHQWYLKWMK